MLPFPLLLQWRRHVHLLVLCIVEKAIPCRGKVLLRVNLVLKTIIVVETPQAVHGVTAAGAFKGEEGIVSANDRSVDSVRLHKLRMTAKPREAAYLAKKFGPGNPPSPSVLYKSVNGRSALVSFSHFATRFNIALRVPGEVTAAASNSQSLFV